jgi:hypothetical protein
MQRTRLNTIVAVTGDRFNRWVSNPWRRFSLQIIIFLGGFFWASVVSLTSGQTAAWDVGVAFLCLGGVELTSWLYYRSMPRRQNIQEVLPPRALWLEMLHAGKLGFVYGLFLDAFKLGS